MTGLRIQWVVTNLGRRLGVVAALVCTAWALGCASAEAPSPYAAASQQDGAQATENRLRVGDELQVRLDVPSARGAAGAEPQLVPCIVSEQGQISLPLIGEVPAAGATPGLLAERIQAHYVPRFYVRCNVGVIIAARYYYVGGEVRGPGRYAWTEDTSVLKAINTAGGFTDYANRGRIELVRGEEKIPVNFEELRRHPGADIPIRPGDSIWVPRSIF